MRGAGLSPVYKQAKLNFPSHFPLHSIVFVLTGRLRYFLFFTYRNNLTWLILLCYGEHDSFFFLGPSMSFCFYLEPLLVLSGTKPSIPSPTTHTPAFPAAPSDVGVLYPAPANTPISFLHLVLFLAWLLQFLAPLCYSGCSSVVSSKQRWSNQPKYVLFGSTHWQTPHMS